MSIFHNLSTYVPKHPACHGTSIRRESLSSALQTRTQFWGDTIYRWLQRYLCDAGSVRTATHHGPNDGTATSRGCHAGGNTIRLAWSMRFVRQSCGWSYGPLGWSHGPLCDSVLGFLSLIHFDCQLMKHCGINRKLALDNCWLSLIIGFL